MFSWQGMLGNLINHYLVSQQAIQQKLACNKHYDGLMKSGKTEAVA
jgi:hypothetical protein